MKNYEDLNAEEIENLKKLTMAKHVTKTLHFRVLDLIELSDIETREHSLPRSEYFSLHEAIQEVVDINQTQAKGQKIEVI
jgi:signal transduction histidine kinase